MKVLITGGAGFIGCNTAARMLELGHEVVIYDNLSRRGTQLNLNWLQTNWDIEFVGGDIRSYRELGALFERFVFDVVIHEAAQVAVTSSVTDPRTDFEVNALGTFNLLEAIRYSGQKPVILFASTNKVYGGLEDVRVVERDGRYEYRDLPNGICENRGLDFHSPYGCSKGCADQYMIDYGRIYGLRTVVFRQSCIYGYRQFGVEDQGWLAWFAIAAALDMPITIYGDGKQIRDVLFIDDLMNVYLAAIDRIDELNHRVYNIGGGPTNTLSLLEAICTLEEILGKSIEIGSSDWRPGDQKVFMSDIRRARTELGWVPKVSVQRGIERLVGWILDNRAALESVHQG